MSKRISQLRALTTQERRVLLASLFLLPTVALTLRLKGYRWTRAFLQKRIPEHDTLTTNAQNPVLKAQSVARMVSIAARFGPYRANCLKQSLVTWWLLQRRGIAAELNIGVNKQAGDFSAHAWVEYSGNTLIKADDTSDQYSTFGPQ